MKRDSCHHTHHGKVDEMRQRSWERARDSQAMVTRWHDALTQFRKSKHGHRWQ